MTRFHGEGFHLLFLEGMGRGGPGYSFIYLFKNIECYYILDMLFGDRYIIETNQPCPLLSWSLKLIAGKEATIKQ